MGHLYSKAAIEEADLADDSQTDEPQITNSLDSKPMDPRSPTPDINRTPIQTLDSNKLQKITKNVDLTKECFEKYNTNTVINPSIRALMNQIDPRSPTLDFQRTPLAVLIKNPELMAKYNLNQHNSSNLFSNEELNISYPENKIENCQRNLNDELTDEHVDNDNVKNLEDSSDSKLAPKPDELESTTHESDYRIPGLLETNLDYVETNLDTVKRKPKLSIVEKCEQTDAVECNHGTDTVEKDEPTNTSKSILMIKNLSNKDPRSPSIGINRTPIVLLDSDKENKLQREEMHSKMQEIFDYNMKLQQKRDVKSDSDFLLIYEDNIDDKNSTPIKKSALVPKVESSRTPLACMMNVHQTNKLISDIPIEKHDIMKKSKIPIKIKNAHSSEDTCSKLSTNFQKISKRNLIDSIENTPPKPRQARWDQDNSVIL